jgi:GNAT superfamily N-acetyltransferase
MSETSVRVLHEDDWRHYRAVRLAALQESPQAFLAAHAEEATQPEQYWRNCMVRAHRLLAERDGAPVGVASIEMIEGAPRAADFHDLWVTPEARNTGIASRLVQAAADRATRDGCTKLYYWVSTENGRAIGFAINAGCRLTSQRRTSRTNNREFGDQEIALVLSLANGPLRWPPRHHLGSPRSPAPTDQAPRLRHPTDVKPRSQGQPPHRHHLVMSLRRR